MVTDEAMKADGTKVWAKSFTSRVGAANNLKYIWGCTAITADPSFPFFISPCADNKALGGLNFEHSLDHLEDGSLILLDEFDTDQRKQILQQL